MKQLLFLLLGFISFKSFSCDCNYQGPFLKVAPESQMIALVKVTRYLTFRADDKMPLSMQVDVVELISGIEPRKKLVVWGDGGADCRPYLSTFNVGSYYVISLFEGGDKEKNAADDFYISNCGAYWLHVNMADGTATGDVNSNDRTNSAIKLSELKSKLPKAELPVTFHPDGKPKNGMYTFGVAFAEWGGKTLGSTVTVIIKGDSIRVVNKGRNGLTGKKGKIIDSGILMKHKSGKWIIGKKPSDVNGNIDGCDEGPSVIDFKRKRWWTC